MRKEIHIFMLLYFIFLPVLAYSADAGNQAISAVRLKAVFASAVGGYDYFRFLVEARYASKFEGILDINKAVRKTLEYFFTSLSVPDDSCWVNLNPDEPSEVLDGRLGDSDMSRVLLKADLRLKEDVSQLINPAFSSEGKEFWRRLYQKAGELNVKGIHSLTKLWIVPDKAEVRHTEDMFSVGESSLKVELAPAYIYQDTIRRNRKQEELEDYAASLISELILPVLDKRINEDYAYADLREAYNALILARWYKQRYGARQTGFVQYSIDFNYSPQEIYQDYLDSITNKEYSWVEREQGPFLPYRLISTKYYFSGGVDLRKIRIRETAQADKAAVDGSNVYFSCEVFAPDDFLELMPGDYFYQGRYAVMSKRLPAISPLEMINWKITRMDSSYKADRIAASRL